MMFMDEDGIYKEWLRILNSELDICQPRDFENSTKPWWYTLDDRLRYDFVKSAVEQMREVALNGTVLRSYCLRYMDDIFKMPFTVPAVDFHGNPTTRILAPEGDGSHTNLLQTIMYLALVAKYGADFGFSTNSQTIDGFEYPHIMQAVAIHELPENHSGDTPDNGARDQLAKDKFENEIVRRCTDKIAVYNRDAADKIYTLISEMQQESEARSTARLLHMCDKFSCNFIVLTYDYLGYSPKMKPNAGSLSKRDIEEMKTCVHQDEAGNCLASEMWAIDMLRLRNIIQYDDTGFLRACLILYTLMVHKYWYSWREDDYRAAQDKI